MSKETTITNNDKEVIRDLINRMNPQGKGGLLIDLLTKILNDEPITNEESIIVRNLSARTDDYFEKQVRDLFEIILLKHPVDETIVFKKKKLNDYPTNF